MLVGTNADIPALTRVYAWFSALASSDTALLDDLLAHGVPVDVPHPLRHSTALMEATRLGRTAIVRWLLERGAAPAFLCGIPVGTPLHCALRLHHWEIAELLIEATPQTTVVDGHGCTPLHILCQELAAAQSPQMGLSLTQRLIAKGCSLDAFDNEGVTALHHCVINDLMEMAELLLSHGADANPLIPDTHVSPLTIAALEKNLPMATLLLRHGANPHLETRDGSSPVSIHPSIVRLVDESPMDHLSHDDE